MMTMEKEENHSVCWMNDALKHFPCQRKISLFSDTRCRCNISALFFISKEGKTAHTLLIWYNEERRWCSFRHSNGYIEVELSYSERFNIFKLKALRAQMNYDWLFSMNMQNKWDNIICEFTTHIFKWNWNSMILQLKTTSSLRTVRPNALDTWNR